MPAGQEHTEGPGQSWYKYGKAHPGRLVRCGIVAGVTTTELRWGEPGSTARRAASKVPQITAIFWIIKVLTTGMGEAASDYLVHDISPVVAVVVGFTTFAASLALQFAVRRYVPWVYWLAVSMVAVFGTMAADVLHVGLGIPYLASTAFFIVVLTVIFVAWHRTEGTLSIHSIYTRRREAFYWATVLATFALGTAAGDLTARTMGLGYLASGILFAVVIAVPGVAHWRLRLNAILAFWSAYIVTRPLGASFADWLAWPHSTGGLALGHGPVSLAAAVVITGFVGYLTVTHKDVEENAPARSPGRARHRQRRTDRRRPVNDRYF